MGNCNSCTFIHAADLHLGSQFLNISGLSKNMQEFLIESSLNSISKLTSYAIKENIDFILISGDIFDSNKPTLKLQDHFFSSLKKLSDHKIKVFLIFGNHDSEIFDKQNDILSKLENVFLFKNIPTSHDVNINNNKIKIHGINFEQDFDLKSATTNILFEHGCFQIFMLHADVSKSRRNIDQKLYSEFDIYQLTEVPVNYWALGHLHNFEILNTEPHLVYPGTIQGRSFKPSEQGPKGFCKVILKDCKIVDCDFIPISEITYEETTISYTMQSDELLLTAKNIINIIEDKFSTLPYNKNCRAIVRINIDLTYESNVARTEPLSLLDISQIEDLIFDNINKSNNYEITSLKWNFLNTINSEIAKEIFSHSLLNIEETIKNDSDFIYKNSKLRQKIPILERINSEELKLCVEKELKRILIGL